MCGSHGSLRNLAQRTGLDYGIYNPPVNPPESRQEGLQRPAAWLVDAHNLIRRYVAHSRSWELWQNYKPVSRDDFDRCRLGVGVLPASKCRHERLIVPIYSGSEVRGLRGRAIDCTCGKWLAPAGTNISIYPLYNEESLRPGCVVWVLENPVDALLLSRRTGFVGVATYSVAYWQDAWTETIRAAQPELVVVAYDNDLPGGGGAARREEMIRDWLRTHPRVPPAAGPRLANRLLEAGLNAVVFDWGKQPAKSDIGSLLMAGA